MKKKITILLYVINVCLLHIPFIFPQSADIHFFNVGKKTNTQVGCNPHGSGFFDYNGDNLPDIFVVHNESLGAWTGKNLPHTLLENQGDGTFSNVTYEAKVQGYQMSAQGFAAADYDNDGRTDLAIAMGYQLHGRLLLFWQGEGGVFWNATNSSGVGHKNRGRNITFVDYNNDGLLDLFSFGDDVYTQYGLLVYKNIGNAHFTLQSSQAGLDHHRGSDLWGFAFADIDNDGDMDFFSANHETDCHLFINNGDGTFSEETTQRGIVKQNNFYGAIFLDYNNDGWFDLFTRRHQGRNILYTNNKNGTFTIDTPGSGLWETLGRPPYGGGLSTADFNNDGYIDILAVTGYIDGYRLYRNNGDNTFTNVFHESGLREPVPFHNCIPIADYNRDGYLDLYIPRTDYYPPDYYATLFENSGGSNHWLHIKLIGVESNRDAIGARVVAYTEGKQQMRQVLGGDSYKMDSLPVEFGLGGYSVVDSLVIYWPSGIVQREMLVPADTMITLTEEQRVYYHSYLVSGEVDYYKQNKKVPSAALEVSGTKSITAYSNQEGFYKFPVNKGYNSIDIIPSKTADSHIGTGSISAYDAGLTARAAEGIKPLTGIPEKAADVNQNNLIDQMDPLLIAKKAVGFSNNDGSQAGAWKFSPSKIDVDRTIESHYGGQDFTGWILGDVDGNWIKSDQLMKKMYNDNVGTSQVVQNDTIVTVVLNLPGNILMMSSDLWLEYDPTLFSLVDIRTTSVTDDFNIVSNNSTQGILKIALYNSVSIWGEDEFLEIDFDIIPDVIDDTTTMHWQQYRINDTAFEKEDITLDLRTFSLYGKVKYYQKNNFVPQVKITLEGVNETFTDNSGIYQFLGIRAGRTIEATPSKQRGEHIGDLVNSAYDAFLTARHVTNVEHVYGLKAEAADVDNNGKIEMSDAEYIAWAAVGFTSTGNSQAGTWEFSPSSFSYENIKDNVEQDFLAYIAGDVNGDWFPDQSAQSQILPKQYKTNDKGTDLIVTGAFEFTIPVSINQGDSLGSADIWGEYDHRALELTEIEKSDELTGFQMMVNDTTPGLFKIALFGTKYVHKSDEILTLHFKVITKEIEETDLKWKHFRINNNEYNKNNIIIDTGVNDYSFSGEVIYYQDSTGVSNTKLQMQGTVNKESFTNSEGYYVFPEISRSDSIMVSPVKARDEQVDNFTISVYDAVLAARHTVGLDSLTGYNLTAADVDTNGIIDMMDAVYIAQRSIGLIDTLSSQAGSWIFTPDLKTCHYVSENIDDGNFTAYILGDVNGDWGLRGKTGKAVTMPAARTLQTEGTDEFCIPLILENDSSLLSADIWLEYDHSVLELTDIKKNTAFQDFHLMYNDQIPGKIKIAFFGVEPVKKQQEFIKLYFNFISEQREEAEVTFEHWCINNIEYKKESLIINTGINEDSEVHLEFKLNSNYPNPFNPETTVSYQIAKRGQVQMIIYNSRGQAIRRLVDTFQNPGKYRAVWNGLDDSGKPVGSGLYFCRLSCDERISVIKMVKLK